MCVAVGDGLFLRCAFIRSFPAGAVGLGQFGHVRNTQFSAINLSIYKWFGILVQSHQAIIDLDKICEVKAAAKGGRYG
jgi:hypothetical protein